jgi:hypothetical protein
MTSFLGQCLNPRQMAKKNRNKCNVTVQNCLNQVHLKVIMINIDPNTGYKWGMVCYWAYNGR